MRVRDRPGAAPSGTVATTAEQTADASERVCDRERGHERVERRWQRQAVRASHRCESKPAGDRAAVKHRARRPGPGVPGQPSDGGEQPACTGESAADGCRERGDECPGVEPGAHGVAERCERAREQRERQHHPVAADRNLHSAERKLGEDRMHAISRGRGGAVEAAAARALREPRDRAAPGHHSGAKVAVRPDGRVHPAAVVVAREV